MNATKPHNHALTQSVYDELVTLTFSLIQVGKL